MLELEAIIVMLLFVGVGYIIGHHKSWVDSRGFNLLFLTLFVNILNEEKELNLSNDDLNEILDKTYDRMDEVLGVENERRKI